MRPVSTQFLRATAGPHKQVCEVTVRLPGESEGTLVAIEEDQCTVSMSGSNGSRYSASLSLSPDGAADTYERAATPGAEFHIRAGIDYGAGRVELIDCGVLYAVDGDRGIALGDFPLTLQDGSIRLEECRFTSPWSIASGTDRGAAIEALVLDANPDAVIRQEATASTMGAAVYQRDRLPAIDDIANGGSIDAAFDAAGEWVIRDMPTIMPAVPSWVVRTGEFGTILENARRQIPLARLYNRVVVGAPEPFQTWGAIVYDIADTSHPRHSSKIGVRPFFVLDPTIASAAQARLVAVNTLTQLLTVVEQISIPTIGNPALEYGDTVAVVHESTEVDPGFAGNLFVEGWTYNLGTSAMDLVGRSTDQPALEESS